MGFLIRYTKYSHREQKKAPKFKHFPNLDEVANFVFGLVDRSDFKQLFKDSLPVDDADLQVKLDDLETSAAIDELANITDEDDRRALWEILDLEFGTP